MTDTPLSRSRRAVVLLVWLLALLAGAAQIARSHFSADLTAFLPASPDAGQRVLIEQLQSGVAARTLLVGIEGGDAAARVAASRALATALRASGAFEQVANGDTGAWSAVGRWLVEHRYALSPAVDARRFTAAGLRDGIDDTLSLLGTPAGNAIKPLLDRDPTGETTRIAEGLIPASAPRSDDGVWVSRQGARALLLLTTRAAGADLDGQATAIATLRQAFAPLAAKGLVLQVSGAPLFAVQSRAQIEHEVRWLAVAGTLLMSTLLLLAFGSAAALGAAMLPVATGVVAGIAAVSWVFGNVHGITLGFGSTLIGESVDYAIYYLIQARGGAGRAGWRHWLAGGWPTVRLGLLTSVCGFAALVFSGFPGLAQLGVFSIAGLVAAATATRFVLPVLMPDGARGVGLRRQLGAFARRAVRVLPLLRWPLLALGAAAALLLWQRSPLWSADLGALSPISRQAQALDESLRADLTADDGGAMVVVQGPSVEATLERTEAAGKRLDALVDAGKIGGYSSVTRWLPSAATQRGRLAALPDAATLRAALDQATQGLPLKAARLAPFVADVEQARRAAPLSADSLRGSPVAPFVDALLLRRADGSAVALMPLQSSGGHEAALDGAAVTAALQGLPGTQMLAISSELHRLYRHYLDEAQTQALLGALGVVVLIGLWLRSWRRVLAVCQPLLLAVLLTLGGLVALHVQLGILHLVGLLLVVAVGSNYALFFDLLRDDPAADDDTLASLLLANLTTVLSFGLIALSAIPALSAIGRVVAPGALLALLLSAAFVPRPAKRV